MSEDKEESWFSQAFSAVTGKAREYGGQALSWVKREGGELASSTVGKAKNAVVGSLTSAFQGSLPQIASGFGGAGLLGALGWLGSNLLPGGWFVKIASVLVLGGVGLWLGRKLFNDFDSARSGEGQPRVEPKPTNFRPPIQRQEPALAAPGLDNE